MKFYDFCEFYLDDHEKNGKKCNIIIKIEINKMPTMKYQNNKNRIIDPNNATDLTNGLFSFFV